MQDRGRGGAAVPEWPPPEGMTGSGALIRVQASHAADEQYTCLRFAEGKTRPNAWPGHRVERPKPYLESFVLGLVLAAVRLVECEGMAPQPAVRQAEDSAGRSLHRAQRRFLRHAVERWLDRDRPKGAPPLLPAPGPWVRMREVDGRTWELTAWGACHHNPGRRLREFSYLCYGSADARSVPKDRVAIAALAAAFGEPARQGAKPWHPYRLLGAEPVDHVRVALTGLHDGSYRLLFEGGPDQVRAYYEEHAEARVKEIVGGGPAAPGGSCAGCRRLETCDAPVRLPGLLGIPAGRGPFPLRELSASHLRYYRKCPQMYFSYAQHLPRTREYSPENQLGKAVHAHLEANHRSGPLTPCGGADMPWGDTAWGDGELRMTGEWARIGSRMLAQHIDMCPFLNDGVTTVLPEPRRAFYDPYAHAVLIVKPDLLYLEHGSWVWRETKTTQSADAWMGRDPFTTDPQLALAVVLLAVGAFGGDPAGSRVELEVLRPDSGDPSYIEPCNEPERVEAARRLVREYVDAWRGDEVFTPRPGAHCRTCPVTEWCASAPEEVRRGRR